MRKNKYTCDICGNEIIPMKRMVYQPNGVPITSNHESIQQIELRQIDTDARNYILTNVQLSKSYDVCDACWDEVIKALRNRKGDLKNVF